MNPHKLKRGEDPNPHDPSTTESNPTITLAEAQEGEKNKSPAQLGREMGEVAGEDSRSSTGSSPLSSKDEEDAA